MDGMQTLYPTANGSTYLDVVYEEILILRDPSAVNSLQVNNLQAERTL